MRHGCGVKWDERDIRALEEPSSQHGRLSKHTIILITIISASLPFPDRQHNNSPSTMPNIQTIRKGIAELPKGPSLVVGLTGGTTGIGSYVAKALARTFASNGSKLRVYIVGRNASRAEELLNYGRSTAPGSDWRFIQASDLTLMSEVNKISQEIIKQEEASPFAGGPARLDVLYMSQALSPMQPSPRKPIPSMSPQ